MKKYALCGKPQRSKENEQNNKAFFPTVRNWNRFARSVAQIKSFFHQADSKNQSGLDLLV